MAQNQEPTDQASIDAFVHDLENEDGITRQKARHALVRIGIPALEALTDTFETKRNAYAHWEAAKAISTIGGPKAVTPLLRALGDNDFSIRWIAAEGLIAIGSSALEALTTVLAAEEPTPILCESAHHVIHDLIHKQLIDEVTIAQVEPLQQVLAKSAGVTLVFLEAAKVLDWLRTNRPSSGT